MTKSRTIIPFFTDQCVPDSVGRKLIEAGHQVTRLRDVMDTDTPDPIISVACSRGGQVLITHDKDFKDLSKRLQISKRQYHDSLHRIQLLCVEPRSAERIVDALALIEFEWSKLKSDSSMVIDINESSIKVHR